MAKWKPLPANRQIRGSNNFAEGLVTNIEPAFVPDSAIIDGYGWDFLGYPALTVRKGRETWGDPGDKIYGLFAYGDIHLIRASGGTLQWGGGINGDEWSNIGGTWAQTDWDATMFDIGGPVLIMTNGSDQASYWNGTQMTGIFEMPKGKYVASDNLRVYTAGVSGTEDYVYYSAYLDATDWTTSLNAGFVQYYTPKGGPITALTTYNGAIWVFKKDSTAIIYNTGDARSTHRMVQISNFIGCVSFKTVKQVGDSLFWLGMENVYMGTGEQAIPIGDPIQRYLKQVDSSFRSECCAFVDGQNYYLCLPVNSTSCNTCLVYSTVYKKWLPYSATMNGIRYGAKFDNFELGGAFIGDVNGMVYRVNKVDTDNGSPIPFSVTSKPYDDGMPEAEKEVYEMHIQGKFPPGTTLTVGTSDRDEGMVWENIDFDPDTLQSWAQNRNLIVPLDRGPLSNYYRYQISGTGRVQINSVQRYSRIQPVQY